MSIFSRNLYVNDVIRDFKMSTTSSGLAIISSTLRRRARPSIAKSMLQGMMVLDIIRWRASNIKRSLMSMLNIRKKIDIVKKKKSPGEGRRVTRFCRKKYYSLDKSI